MDTSAPNAKYSSDCRWREIASRLVAGGASTTRACKITHPKPCPSFDREDRGRLIQCDLRRPDICVFRPSRVVPVFPHSDSYAMDAHPERTPRPRNKIRGCLSRVSQAQLVLMLSPATRAPFSQHRDEPGATES